jgi:hypothetical protein
MDIEAKKRKIIAIDSEVNKFHPLLSNLLSKLPQIRNVEYNHGPNEKGADFVLTRYEEIIDDTLYIGVIAKIGKIQVDITEIERQIKSCELSRFILNGKKNINLSEIWVITNNTISNHAEELINHSFKDKKILFIECNHIVKWIEKYLPNYWYDYNIEIGDYLNQLRIKTHELDKQFNLLKCTIDKPIYIEQDIYERKPEYSNKPSKSHRVNIFEAIKSERVIVLEGSMGSGKSKLLRKIVEKCTEGEYFAEHKFLPVHATYSDLVDNYNFDFRKLIKNKVGDKTINVFPADAKYLLLIDAVDEKDMPLNEQIEALTSLIATISAEKDVHALITTRPLRSFAESRAVLKNSKFYELYPLSMNRIVEFLHAICKMTNISNRIVEDLKRSSLFKELPKSPIAAILLANLLNENTKDLPSNITELYTKCVELMLGRWDVDKGLQSQKEYEAADAIAMKIAAFIIDNNLKAVPKGDVKQMFSEYLKDRNLGITPENLYDKIIKRSGLLLENSFDGNVYYKHKTFAEYMYAKALLKKKGLTVDNRAFTIYWDNIYFFYAGLQKDCSDFLQELVDLKPETNAHRWNKIVNMSNFFLAGFTSPYTVVSENLHKILLDASSLHSAIAENKIKSPFASFSVVHLLWLFQMIIRDSYSYDFFRNALSDINLSISLSDAPEQEKIFAHFYSAVISMDLEEATPFDYLIKEYGDRLPMPVKLGIMHEVEKSEHPSHPVKKYTKKIRQMIRESKHTHDLVTSLYKKPIDVRKIT